MGTSWLTTVKKVFRSPSKTSPKKSCKRRDERRPEDDEEEQKKTEKRRWIFKKTASNNQEYEAHMSCNNDKKRDSNSIHEKRPAIATMEVNKTVAKVAVRVKEMVPAYLAREYYAALIIQTAFRGYLARRALSALKGIVQLQALVRGHNIRKQAKTTLKCMQTLMRVQAKLRDQSLLRPSHGQTRKSMYAESNNLWDKYKDIHHRKPMFEDERYIEDQCKAYSYAIEDIEALLQTKKEASLNREQALAYALSQQIRRLDQKICSKQENHKSEWLGQWLESEEYCENDNRVLTNRIETIKDVDIDSLQFNLRTPLNLRQSYQHQDPPSRRHSLHAQPMTPTLREVRSIQAQSASPRCVKGYRSHSAATTPSLRHRPTSLTTTTPNYMAATESAKAKARTQSTPRQRHSTSSDRSERGISSVKKRLSFPVPNEAHQYQRNIYDDYSCFSQNLRSPSFRSVQEGLYCLERGTTCSSYTDITGGEASPASTSRLRRWLS